ncbi:hypothetical protein BDF22DRAFT_740335 [Syncephalis plumigaleata]|nr:hypothetical protein BDF22DRAFT_740335 [Syncephalis plumigaleata]
MSSGKRTGQSQSMKDNKRQKGRSFFAIQASRAAGFGMEPNQSDSLLLVLAYAEQLYPDSVDGKASITNDNDNIAAATASESTEIKPLSVEDEIAQELASMQQAKEKQTRLFTSLNTSTECVVFIRTRPPVEPVSMAMTMLRDFADTQKQRTRYTNRIVPITLTCRSSLDDIEQMATTVLAPIFHTEDAATNPIKLIRLIARIVGPHHKVDLKQPDRTIIVEVLKSVCGMSVVEHYNELKRFNVYMLTSSTTAIESNKE